MPLKTPNKKVTTASLLQRLFRTANIENFIKNNNEYMKREPFDVYLNRLCVKKNAVPERIIVKSGIARTYGHQLFNGTRNPSRDKVIQLAFGFELNYRETQELLKIARKSLLHPKVKRDAVILYALNKGFSVVDTQETLKELALPLLGKEDRYE